MSNMDGKWELSFGSNFIEWDGKLLHLADWDGVRAALELYRQLGLRWVMTGGLQYVERADFDVEEGARRYAELLDEFDMRISSQHCVLPSVAPLDDSQEPLKEMMRRTVDTCAIIRSRALVIHSGMVMGKPNDGTALLENFEAEANRHGFDRVLEVMADNFKFMARLARERDMTLAFETMGRFIHTGETAVLPRLIEMIDEPNAGYCLDSGHLNAFGESTVEWVRLAGDKLFETHFHDNRGRGLLRCPEKEFVVPTREIDEHLPVGFGTTNWMDVILALDEIGFKGPVSFETGGWPRPDRFESFRLAILWWRACERLAMERKA